MDASIAAISEPKPIDTVTSHLLVGGAALTPPPTPPGEPSFIRRMTVSHHIAPGDPACYDGHRLRRVDATEREPWGGRSSNRRDATRRGRCSGMPFSTPRK